MVLFSKYNLNKLFKVILKGKKCYFNVSNNNFIFVSKVQKFEMLINQGFPLLNYLLSIII